MRYETIPLRPGLTAIAAALALSSTPLFAQSADSSTAAPAAPVEIAPPAPAAVTPAPAVAPMATSSTPVVHTPDESATDTTSTPRTGGHIATKHQEKTASTVKATRVERAAEPAEAPTPAPVAPVPPPTVAPVAAVPVPPPAVMTPVPRPAPLPVARNDETIEYAAGGALALIVIAGGAFLLLRRRRDEEDVYEMIALESPTGAGQPVAAPAVFAAQPNAPAPIADPVGMPASDLPEGFDISRFGPHVQAAYRGPTSDNPSLSLKTRLKRARFFDQRERLAPQAERAPGDGARRGGNPFMLRPETRQLQNEPEFQI